MNSITDNLRYAMDVGLGVPGLLGINPYSCYLTTQMNEQSNVDNFVAQTVATRTDTLITVGNTPQLNNPDGYYNPQVVDAEEQQLIVSQGALVNNLIKMGPIVLPYSIQYPPLVSISGGTDPSVFYQAISQSQTEAYWVWIQGEGLNAQNGNYYLVKSVRLEAMHNLCYWVMLEATSTIPSTPPTI